MTIKVDRILSFDPGETTGIAFLNYGTLQLGINAHPYMFQKDDFLSGLVRITSPTCIVIETPPQAARFNVTSHIHLFQHILKWFTVAGFHVVVLKPGQWKKMISRSKISSAHIRDAADMGRYVFGKMGNE